jgi:FkbM family methyltransferase
MKKEFRYHSQFGQDKWVLEQTNFKRNGYFVDIGAYDGVSSSNTYILEKNFSWRGICVEPGETNRKLTKNRDCFVEKKPLFDVSGLKVNFSSGLNDFWGGIFEYLEEKYKVNVPVKEMESISLYDVLKKYNAPNKIDYLSIDTEGSEYEIIKNFPFEKYEIRLITIEHNAYSREEKSIEKRKKIFKLLTNKGYKKCNNFFFGLPFSVFSEYDTSNIEDWYILGKYYSPRIERKYLINSVYLYPYYLLVKIWLKIDKAVDLFGIYLKKTWPSAYYKLTKIKQIILK